MSCEPNSPTGNDTAALAVPKLMTLRKAIDRDGVPAACSSKQRRLMDIHVTAYPGVLNERALPKHNTIANDLSSIDPLQYRKAHTVRDNNAGSYTGKEKNVVEMLTTKQHANHMTNLGLQLRAARLKNPENAPTIRSLEPRGYRSRFTAPSFDERSTYRWDYCNWEGDGFQDTRRRERLATYRDGWKENEKADVDMSMKIPFLTMPVSSDRLKDKSTIYRKDYMKNAADNEYRSLSYKTNLEDLGTTYAYSAYSLEDPRRQVRFDESIAALKTPHNFVETFNQDKSYLEKSMSAKKASVREELDRLRAMQREMVHPSVAKSAVAESNDSGKRTRAVLIPGQRGSGYRCVPNKDSYVLLPRDHFNYQAVDDF
ncbi:hypothetical protein JKF63_00252 [Porcisia hertigi]|uniref:Uncharacterized protein n=1 Tax=Porcisia hertigi TaxID=2761500 RepID=A0A836L6P3_9TRYP|nr:hypothetical protein JKF63_00252 [Porcisia hertigi]